MKTFFTITLMVLVADVLTGCGFVKGKPAADRAIAKFHQLYNQGDLETIWNNADPQFREASGKSKYQEFLGAVERKLGKVTSSSNTDFNINTSNFKTTVHMTQQTSFEKGQGTESFTFALHGTNAVLVGYHIESMDLITK